MGKITDENLELGSKLENGMILLFKFHSFHNYLESSFNTDPLTPAEAFLLFETCKKIGHKWSKISKLLENRSENCIKNFFYSAQKLFLKQTEQICSEYH